VRNLARALHLGTVADFGRTDRLSRFTLIVAVVPELMRPVAFHGPRTGEVVVRLQLGCTIHALRNVAVFPHDVVGATSTDSLKCDVRTSVLDQDEVFEEISVTTI